jgi:hypothetical protein
LIKQIIKTYGIFLISNELNDQAYKKINNDNNLNIDGVKDKKNQEY